MTRILFILKRQDNFSTDNYSISTGLWNSARLIVDVLQDNGVEAKLAEVIDNNDIDREVTLYQPTEVIIEALWVVPEKFGVLTALHPNIKWHIRLHSELPFLANEGIAMKWIIECVQYKNVYIACNSLRILEEIRYLLLHLDLAEKVWYAPNCYEIEGFLSPSTKLKQPNFINVGCFGAIRPMKNQLTQAVAAIKFADSLNLQLRFHINVGRAENDGSQVLKNLRGLFEKLDHHSLIEHGWMPHDRFMKIVEQLDIGMQVSLSETFNIVAADMVCSGIPIVTSREIRWASRAFAANPNSTDDIVCKLKRAWMFNYFNVKINQRRLKQVSRDAAYCWLEWIEWLAARKG